MRKTHADEPRKDPLAELARIIGDDNLYADLLMNRTRGPEVAPARETPAPRASGFDDDESHIPAMPLRIDPPFTPAPPPSSLNWDELERDLARFSVQADVPPPPQFGGDHAYVEQPAHFDGGDAYVEERKSLADTYVPAAPESLSYAAPDEQSYAEPDPEPYDAPADAGAIDSWALRGMAEAEQEPVVGPQPDPFALRSDAFDRVDETLSDMRGLGVHSQPEPADELTRLMQAEARIAQDMARDGGRDIYDFERRAADILDDERVAEPLHGLEGGHAALAGAVAAGAALATRYPRDPYEGGRDPSMRMAAAEAEPVYSAEGHMPPHGVHVFPEDAPRRKGGLAAIGVVVGLAAVGALGVVGYRAMSRGPVGEPKLVKAENTPLKVPAQQESNNVAAKAIVDRMEAGKDKVVTREEQPLSMADQASQMKPPSVPSGPRVIPLTPPAAEVPAVIPQAPATAPAGEGATPPASSDTSIRTVRTVPVPGPGASIPAATPPASTSPAAATYSPAAPAPSVPPVVTVPAVPQISPPPSAPEAPPVEPGSPPLSASLPLPRPIDAGEPRKVKTVQVSPDGRIAPQATVPPVRGPNAPLSLRPQDQPVRSAPPQQPQEQAAVQPRPATGGGNYVVQITSVRTDAEARSAFSRLQGKYDVLSGYSPNIRAVDLGAKGTYHRVRVGPMARDNADDVCRQIKSSGGDCIVQSN